MGTSSTPGPSGSLLETALDYARATLGADRAVFWERAGADQPVALRAESGLDGGAVTGAATFVTPVLDTDQGGWSLEVYFADRRRAIGRRDLENARRLTTLLASVITRECVEARLAAAELAAERRARQQQAAAELGLRALEGIGIDELMAAAAAAMADTLDADLVGIGQLLRGGERVRLRTVHGAPRSAVGTVVPLADSTMSFVLHRPQPAVVGEWEQERRWPYPAALREQQVRSSIAVRVPGRARPFGVIAAHAREPHRFGADDAGFAQQVANVLAAALDRERGQRALADAEHLRRDVVAHLLRAADEERAWIATELHNDTIQAMTAALISIDRQVKAATDAGEQRLAEISALVRETLSDAVDRTRRLTFELHPQLLEAKGLDEAVARMAEDAARKSGFTCELRLQVGRYPAPLESLAYRVVRELVANVQQHAGAHSISVSLVEQGGRLEGSVGDDGCGFDGRAALTHASERAGFGLNAAAERVRLAGGRFDIESRRGAGTLVRFRIPLR